MPETCNQCEHYNTHQCGDGCCSWAICKHPDAPEDDEILGMSIPRWCPLKKDVLDHY